MKIDYQMARSAKSGFRLFQALSLDVVGGALAMGVLAVHVLGVYPNPWWWVVLALAVWVVYTADHLLDGLLQKADSVMFRHRLHFHFRYVFAVFLLVAAGTAVVIVVVCLNLKIFWTGIGLSMAVLLYLALVYFGQKKNFYFQKEFFISLFYVSGIWLAPVIWNHHRLVFSQWAMPVLLMVMAWAEGLVMTYYESVNDRRDHKHSFCTFYGASATRRIAGFLLSFSFFAAGLMAIFSPQQQSEFIILSLMSALLLLLVFFPCIF
jgi:hypothetical protein